jgi:uncharacterized protein YjaZ
MKNEKFTAIYVERWMSGSHHHALTKFKRIEVKKGESVLDALTREGIAENTEYLFHGWSRLQGEIEPVK